MHTRKNRKFNLFNQILIRFQQRWIQEMKVDETSIKKTVSGFEHTYHIFLKMAINGPSRLYFIMMNTKDIPKEERNKSVICIMYAEIFKVQYYRASNLIYRCFLFFGPFRLGFV